MPTMLTIPNVLLSGLSLAVDAEHAELDLVGQLRGWGVAIFAVLLFCGSIYLLLATNVGSKLGFLVSFAALTGFISMLGMVWATSLFPLNALHGDPPAWVVREVTDEVAQSGFEAVRDIEEVGQVPDDAVVGEVRAALDTALTDEGGEFQRFNSTAEYLDVRTLEMGGGGNIFNRPPHYAVVEIHPVLRVEALPGQAPPPPRPDPDRDSFTVVLVRDLGALRLPQYLTIVSFGILFAISLFLLHKLERSEQKREEEAEPERELEPTPA